MLILMVCWGVVFLEVGWWFFFKEKWRRLSWEVEWKEALKDDCYLQLLCWNKRTWENSDIALQVSSPPITPQIMTATGTGTRGEKVLESDKPLLLFG